MEKSLSAERSSPPPIPTDLYYHGAASSLLGKKFHAQPTVHNRILDRLIRSSGEIKGPASHQELLELAEADQALRYSLRRLRALFGDDFFEQTGAAPDSTYQRRESDAALARRFTPPVVELSIEHAAKRHFLATNRPALLQFTNHLFEHYKIDDPVEQEMLRSVVLLGGLPFSFKHRDPDIMSARIEVFRSVREKLDGLRKEVIFVKNGKAQTRQRLHPIGSVKTIPFARPEWLADIPGFHPLEAILEAHRERFGRTLPLRFFGPQMKLPFRRPSAPTSASGTTRVAVSDSCFLDSRFTAANALFGDGGDGGSNNGNGGCTDDNGKDSRPSTRVESVRSIGPEGKVFVRRRNVVVVHLPSSTSVPAPQSPESPSHS